MNSSYPYYRPTDSSEVFTITPGGKFENNGYVAVLSLLIAPYCLNGYDAPAHFSEETLYSYRRVPFAMKTSFFLSSLVGFIYMISYLLSITAYLNTKCPLNIEGCLFGPAITMVNTFDHIL
jgi:hypothetical protein